MRYSDIDDKKDYNRFDYFAQQVWEEPDLARKKELITKLMINRFAFPRKAETFRKAVEKATRPEQIDQIAANLVLIQGGDKVIK